MWAAKLNNVGYQVHSIRDNTDCFLASIRLSCVEKYSNAGRAL